MRDHTPQKALPTTYPLLTLCCTCWLALRQVLVLARLIGTVARHQSLHEVTTQPVLTVSPKNKVLKVLLGAHTSMWNLAKVGELCHCVAECNLSCHPGRQAQAQRPACFACDRCQVPIWLASHLVHQDVKLESDTRSFESLRSALELGKAISQGSCNACQCSSSTWATIPIMSAST